MAGSALRERGRACVKCVLYARQPDRYLEPSPPATSRRRDGLGYSPLALEGVVALQLRVQDGARAVGVGAPLIEWRVHVFGDGRVKTKAGAAGAGNWPLMSRISAEVTVEC